MKWLHSVSSLLLAGFSVVIFVSSLKLGIGSFKDPGPGFMGFLASILLFLLTLIIVIKETMKPAEEKGEEPSVNWGSLTKPFVLTVALCCYAAVLDTVGYLLSTFLLMFIMLFVDNPRKWHFHVFSAFVIVNVTYVVFYKMLRVLLPVGTFHIFW